MHVTEWEGCLVAQVSPEIHAPHTQGRKSRLCLHEVLFLCKAKAALDCNAPGITPHCLLNTQPFYIDKITIFLWFII